MFLRAIFWCWDIFILFWLLNLFTNKRTLQRETTASRLRYSLLFVLAFWLLYDSHLRHPANALGLILIPHSPALRLASLVLTVVSLSLAIWARVILGKNWSGAVTFKENHELIDRGPYALVRHPIYTGMLGMFLGTALAVGTLGALLGFPLLVFSFWIKYRREEALMLEHFGDRYRLYMNRVKALIPFLF